MGHEIVRRLAWRTCRPPGRHMGRNISDAYGGRSSEVALSGARSTKGVIDPWRRVFSYPGQHVVDGSAVPANPGGDVALTITAFGCARRAPLEPKASRMKCRLLRPPDNLRHHADKDMRGSALPKQK
jgi:hypothetical protein